jgi:hypothetical protein
MKNPGTRRNFHTRNFHHLRDYLCSEMAPAGAAVRSGRIARTMSHPAAEWFPPYLEYREGRANDWRGKSERIEP